MGQNSSNLGGNAPSSPRRKSTAQKPARPHAPPKIPKPPNYVVPENKVIPNGIKDMEEARKLLRPVSQELTKVHPDFADIFQYDPEIDFLAGGDDSSLERSLSIDLSNKENSSIGLSNSLGDMTTTVNYHPNGNGSIPKSLLESKSAGDLTNTDSSKRPAALSRSQSLQRDRSHPAKHALHKRQASFSNGSNVNQSIIVEDPREHLYNITRDQPFSNMMPSTTSLPLENSFGLDYSFNLTYAQLAEHRRQKKTSELEEKTGKKLSDLSAEIKANNVVPKSPFERQNIGAKSGPLSVSTGSSETGVSKSKKKRAPPPPGQGKVNDFSSQTQSEPPADYDMEDMPSMNWNGRNSSASRNLKSPAPQPFPKRMSVPVLNQTDTPLSHRISISKTNIPLPPLNNIESVSVSTTPLVNPPPPPPPPPPPVNFQSYSVVKSKSDSKSTLSDIKTSPFSFPGQSSVHESVDLAKAQLKVLERLRHALNNPPPKLETKAENQNDAEIISGTVVDTVNDTKENIVEKSGHQIEEKDNNNEEIINSKRGNEASSETVTSDRSENKAEKPPSAQCKKLNSLLQHDIVLAAQARGTRLKKTRHPPALEKPLDASEIFRQELAKAASAREDRRRNVLTNGSNSDDMESRSSNSQSSSQPSTPRIPRDPKDAKETSESNATINFPNNPSSQLSKEKTSFDQDIPMKKDHGFVQDITMSKTELDTEFLVNGLGKGSDQPSIHSEDMSISSGNSQRIFSSSWVPEDDLDSDDDILAQSRLTANQSLASEGFKSSIIPSKIKDLKSGKKEKRRQMKKGESNVPAVEKKKLESVRKLKDSVQSSVKNAFGSISRASGKLLKKHKSQDFLDSRESDYTVPSPQVSGRKDSNGSNWELAGSQDGSLRRSASDANMDHSLYSNGEVVSDSSSDAESDVGDIDFAVGLNYSHEEPREKNGNKLNNKRASSAYVKGEGERIFMLENENKNNVENDDTKTKRLGKTKLFRKRGKVATPEQSTAGKGRLQEDEMSREIREKERQLQLQRQKQLEMENNFRRLRDLDTQERLQRIQTANMRQQITMLQQQQVQQAHVQLNNDSLGLSTPALSNSSVPQGVPMTNSTFMTSSSLDFATMPSLPHQVRDSSLGYTQQSQYHTPRSGELISQNVPAPMFSGTFNASQFTAHSGPIIGAPPITPTAPDLTNQELSYLSDYMRVMGVQPPSTQQQWALLLSTIRLDTSTQHPHGFGFHQSPVHSGVQMKGSGPNLSRLFNAGKRLEDTLVDSSPRSYPDMMGQAYPVRPYISAYNSVGSVDSNLHLNNHLLMNGDLPYSGIRSSSRSSPFIIETTLDNTPNSHNLESTTNSHTLDNRLIDPTTSKDSDSSKLSTTVDQNSHQTSLTSKLDTVYPSAVGNGELLNHNYSEATTFTSTSQTSPEQRMNFLTASANFRSQDTSLKDADESMVANTRTQQSSKFSSKAYGPIGFRPVSFSAGATS